MKSNGSRVFFGAALTAAVLMASRAVPASSAKAERRRPPAGMVEVDGRFFPDFALLPPVPFPADNPPTPKKIQLGETLFKDKRLSGDGLLSCSSCHDPKLDFSDDFDRAHGRGGKELFRRTRSLKNVAYNTSFFWDGRAATLESQFFDVLRSPDEMNMDPQALVERLKEVPAYRSRFQDVFGTEGISTRTISYAVTAYERTLRVGDTILDEYLRGEVHDMVPPALAGMALFKGKARCIVCHNGPTLSDGKFHNTGFSPAKYAREDLGRERVDGSQASRRKFRTPMLRNSSRNTPYFHDGSVGNIEVMLDVYNRGGDVKEGLDPDIRPLHLTRRELLQLKTFLYYTAEKDSKRNRGNVVHNLSAQEEEIYRDSSASK